MTILPPVHLRPQRNLNHRQAVTAITMTFTNDCPPAPGRKQSDFTRNPNDVKVITSLVSTFGFLRNNFDMIHRKLARHLGIPLAVETVLATVALMG